MEIGPPCSVPTWTAARRSWKRGCDRWEEYLVRLGHKLLPVQLSENGGTAEGVPFTSR